MYIPLLLYPFIYQWTFGLKETHFRPEDTCRLKVRVWRTIYHANGHQKKARVATLISDKLDSKIKTVTRDEERHYIIIKGSIHQEDLAIVNIYAPNLMAHKYINQLITNINKLINNIIIVGDLNTTFIEMDRSCKQKITRKTMALNDTLDQMDLTDIFRTFCPKAAEYTFFLSAHGTFSRIDDILVHKSTLSTKKLKSHHAYFPITMLSNLKSTTRKNLKRPQIHGT